MCNMFCVTEKKNTHNALRKMCNALCVIAKIKKNRGKKKPQLNQVAALQILDPLYFKEAIFSSRI